MKNDKWKIPYLLASDAPRNNLIDSEAIRFQTPKRLGPSHHSDASMYEKFKELDGTHPWRKVSPDGYVDYRAHYRPKGRVLYFNFPLATELELIPADHPRLLNKD